MRHDGIAKQQTVAATLVDEHEDEVDACGYSSQQQQRMCIERRLTAHVAATFLDDDDDMDHCQLSGQVFSLEGGLPTVADTATQLTMPLSRSALAAGVEQHVPETVIETTQATAMMADTVAEITQITPMITIDEMGQKVVDTVAVVTQVLDSPDRECNMVQPEQYGHGVVGEHLSHPTPTVSATLTDSLAAAVLTQVIDPPDREHNTAQLENAHGVAAELPSHPTPSVSASLANSLANASIAGGSRDLHEYRGGSRDLHGYSTVQLGVEVHMTTQSCLPVDSVIEHLDLASDTSSVDEVPEPGGDENEAHGMSTSSSSSHNQQEHEPIAETSGWLQKRRCLEGSTQRPPRKVARTANRSVRSQSHADQPLMSSLRYPVSSGPAQGGVRLPSPAQESKPVAHKSRAAALKQSSRFQELRARIAEKSQKISCSAVPDAEAPLAQNDVISDRPVAAPLRRVDAAEPPPKYRHEVWFRGK
jgi:hypothetical protein